MNPVLCIFLVTGGNIITNGSYVSHTFTKNGHFYLSNPINAEVLVVAGGGAGGGRDSCGGGGAGGLIYVSSTIISAGNHSVIIGAGGVGIANLNGNSGENSSFLNYIAAGGGAGPRHDGYAQNGGSGGGGGRDYPKLGAKGIVGQGSDGGFGFYTGTDTNGVGGGGGGAGEKGKNTSNLHNAGNGGSGLYFDQFAHAGYPPGWFAGGGGGSPHRSDALGTVGIGGLGGGGSGGGDSGSVTHGRPGVPNTGGGGGASRWDDRGIGGTGGSGIVIIRYMNQPTRNINVFSSPLILLLTGIIIY